MLTAVKPQKLMAAGRAFAAITEFHPELTAFRRDLHVHPELTLMVSAAIAVAAIAENAMPTNDFNMCLRFIKSPSDGELITARQAPRVIAAIRPVA